MAVYNYTGTSVSNLFKQVYEDISEVSFHTRYPLMSQVKVFNNFTGNQIEKKVRLSFSGSVGSGSLPESNVAQFDRAIFGRKKVYGRLGIDRETMKAAMGKEGAFVPETQEYVKLTVETYSRYAMKILFNNSDGSLGTIDSGGVSGSNPYTLTMTAATWNEARFEEQEYVNIETGNTDLFEITAVNPASRAITVQRLSGIQIPAGGDKIFVQGSEDNEPQGIEYITSATSGSLYSIPVARRWKSYQKAAGGVNISPDLLQEAILEMDRTVQKKPTHLAVSYVQYRKLLNQMEEKKRFTMKPSDSKFSKANISYSGVAFDSDGTLIPIIPERFVDDDKCYLLNFDYIEMHKAPDFGWFDDDGTVLMRSATADEYEARYGGYWNLFIHPAFQGRISGLKTT